MIIINPRRFVFTTQSVTVTNVMHKFSDNSLFFQS